MIQFTFDAQTRLNQYLGAVRANMRGAGVHPDEIETDIREHVSAALAGAAEPIAVDQLDSVLNRLGRPAAWVRDEDLPPWRRVARRLSSGPEDWRLAYLTFGLTLFGILLFPFGGFLLLLGAFLFARSWVDLTGDPADPRRWLVYPAIVLVLLFIGLALVILPIPPLAAWGVGDEGFYRALGLRGEDLPVGEQFRISFGFLSAALGAWWLILSIFGMFLAPRLARWFSPFMASLGRRHAVIFMVFALVLMAGGLGALFLF